MNHTIHIFIYLFKHWHISLQVVGIFVSLVTGLFPVSETHTMPGIEYLLNVYL